MSVVFIEQIIELVIVVEDGAVVLCPGDSPSKFIQVMKILYGGASRHGGTYTVPDVTTDVTKKINIIEFPLSNAGDSDPKKLDRYIRRVLQRHNVDLNSPFYLFDFIRSGTTYEALEASLRRISGDKEFELEAIAINLAKLKAETDPKLYDIYQHMVVNGATKEYREKHEATFRRELVPCTELEVMLDLAEETGSRCVPRYYVNESKTDSITDLYYCNLAVARFVVYGMRKPKPVA